VAAQVMAEGAKRLVIVSDEPEKYTAGMFPTGTTIHHRDALDDIQRDLRETEGCTIMIYDQTCAAEKRRRRKRGTFPDPAKRVVINELVCEGCGDCGVKSNCVSVVPKETEFGRKRQIDQSSYAKARVPLPARPKTPVCRMSLKPCLRLKRLRSRICLSASC
jgi:indolepyruvate ferredoxin oxidoreductase